MSTSSLLYPALVLIALLMPACGAPEPVVPGTQEEGGASGEDRAPETLSASILRDREPGQPPEPSAEPYQRPDGVYVDIRWLGGRSYSSVTAELTDQLGASVGHEDLGTGQGREVRYQRGSVREVRDSIYMVRVELPRPMTRSEALEITGFPATVTRWRTTHREYRLGREFGFERFRLARAVGESDRVVAVEAWKTSPSRVAR